MIWAWRGSTASVYGRVPTDSQWFTLPSIEPIHRSSQWGFNTHPHNHPYSIYCTVAVLRHKYTVSYLQLPLISFSYDSDFDFPLCPSSLFHLIIWQFLFIPLSLFIFFSPTTNLCESVHLLSSTHIDAQYYNISIDKTHTTAGCANRCIHTQCHVYLYTLGRPTDSQTVSTATWSG